MFVDAPIASCFILKLCLSSVLTGVHVTRKLLLTPERLRGCHLKDRAKGLVESEISQIKCLLVQCTMTSLNRVKDSMNRKQADR